MLPLRIRSNIAALAPTAGVSLLFLALLWPFARLDFDRHHDGYMLNVAIAHHEGLDLHSQVASQYGPLTHWTQALFVHLPVAPAFALRIWTVVILALTAGFIADIGRVAPKGWRITPTASRLAGLIWILMCDLWIGISMYPWSSVLASFLLIIALHRWVSAERVSAEQHVSTPSSRRASVDYTIVGLCIGLTPFARINVGLAAVCGISAFLLISARLSAPAVDKTRAAALAQRHVLIGITIGLALPALRLLWTRAIPDYIEQSILQPIAWSRSSGWNPIPVLWQTFKQNVGAVGSLLVVLTLHLRASRGHPQPTRRLATGLIAAIAVAWIGIARVTHPGEVIVNPRVILSEAVAYPWGSFTNSFLHLGLVSTAVAAAAIACMFLFARNWRDALGREAHVVGAAAVLAVADLVQIYPTHDSRHIWWGLPIGILLLIWSLSIMRRSTHPRSGAVAFLPLAPLVLALVVTAGAGWMQNLETQRASHPSAVSSAGFRSAPEVVAALEADQLLVQRALGTSESILYYVYDYDLATMSSEYRVADRFPNPPASRLATRLSDRPLIVLDDVAGHFNPHLEGDDLIQEFTRGTDYFLATRSPTRTVLAAPPCIGGNCGSISSAEVCMAWGSCRPRSFRPEDMSASPLVAGTQIREIPNEVLVAGFSTSEQPANWMVDRLGGQPLLVPEARDLTEQPNWIISQRAVLRFSSLPDQSPLRLTLVLSTAPGAEADVSVLTTAQQKSIRVTDTSQTIEVYLDANKTQEVVLQCQVFMARAGGEGSSPACARLSALRLDE